ncbi:MAG: hypothetical protein HWN67_18480 [Candidatus Helarchaeota archaeon]|nr:hypothetical protein [Candidatus Helarchaeota archaeon]
MDIIIYTKEKCPKCEVLLSFLDKYKVFYLEKKIEDELVIGELLTYDYILKNFCDDKQCLVTTPVISLDGEFLHKEIFGIGGLNEEKAKKIFKIK